MRKETQAFVYKWTELSTAMWYIGSRSRKGCHPNDGYLCSSKRVKKLIELNPSNWSREIFIMTSPEDAVPYETDLLQGLDAKNDPMSYNLHNGDGNFSMIGVEPWNKGLSVSWNKGLPVEKQPGYRKTPTERVRKLLSEQKLGANNPQFGKQSWNSGLQTGRQSQELIEKRVAPLRGKSRSKEVRDKISATKKANNLGKIRRTWEEMFGIEYSNNRRQKLLKQKRDSHGRLQAEN